MTEALPTNILAERIGTWYRGVSIDLTGEILEARRQSIEKLAQDLNHTRAADAVAYAHGRRNYGQGLIEWIRGRGTEFDPDFKAKAADLEPKVMLACALAHHLVTYPAYSISTTLSLLILSADFRGYPTSARSQNLPALATRQLDYAASEHTSPPKPSATTSVKKVNALFKDLGEPPNSGGPDSGLLEWLQALRSATESLARRNDKLENTLLGVAATGREGLDQTAWLLDDYCELGGGSWSEMKLAAVLLSGAELGAITATPSLAQSGVMLRSTLLKAGRDPNAKVKSLDAVQKAAASLDLWPSGNGHQLLPLSVGIDAWRERGRGSGAWRTLAKENHGGAIDGKSEAELADQAFREFLIVRNLTNDRD